MIQKLKKLVKFVVVAVVFTFLIPRVERENTEQEHQGKHE